MALLVLLKTFQRLGYFVKFVEVPPAVIQHIICTAQCPDIPDDITAYDNSTYRVRYMNLVRIFMNVSAFDAVARRIVIEASVAAARTRDDLADIINIAIEELVRQRYELPVFNTLLHIARTARSAVNRDYPGTSTRRWMKRPKPACRPCCGGHRGNREPRGIR